jgi:hypothetical protein
MYAVAGRPWGTSPRRRPGTPSPRRGRSPCSRRPPDIQASGNTATTSSLSSDSASSSRSGPLSMSHSSTAAISLAVTRSHRRHVHSSSATSEPGRVPPRSPRSRLMASPWRVLDPHPHGDWTRSRHSSSESGAAASSSIAGSPSLSVRMAPNYASHDTRDRGSAVAPCSEGSGGCVMEIQDD